MSDENGDKVTEGEHVEGQQHVTEQQPVAKPGSSWLGRFLWVGPRVAEARATGFAAGQPGFDAYDIARQICDDVVKIGETGKGSWAVLLLDCTTVELLVRAHLARAGKLASTGGLSEADWAAARQLPAMESAWAKLSPEHAATLMALLGPERDATLAKLTEDTREAFATALHDFVMRLAEPLEFEANRLGRALFARWSRIAVVAVAALALVGFGGKWAMKKFGPPNLALHRPVTVSSVHPSTPEASALVDGDSEVMGFHTSNGAQQWAIIDLGAVKKFDKIVVYNRPDFQERAVPLKIEVSKDNVTYTQIAERTEVFDKWTAKHLHAEGRYVRLKNTPPNFFHLSEVEIY